MVECDQRLELAQVVGVAEPMGDAIKAAVGFEAVVDDNAAGKLLRHIAPFGRNAVKREAPGCDCVQPLRLAIHAKAGLVEAAHARRSGQRADAGCHGQEGLRPPRRPLGEARPRETVGAEKIGERLSRAVLGIS
jgi:hypothetical protein